MDQEDLKTAKKVELVESGSQTSDHTVVVPGRVDNSQTGNTNSHTLASDVLTSDLANPDRIIGKIIGGHYEIVSPIGHGGMSTVYKARHQHLQKDVAIKFLSVGRQFDGKAIARFREEAKAASGLLHSNICATREYGVEDGVPYLVMDYVEGTSLGDLLAQEKSLSEKRAIEIILGVCAGLESAHASRVIHRDIKPANILLTKDHAGAEAIKIVDFGIAKLIREDESGPNLTQTGEVFGTPKYMSPEQCLGNKVDQRSDIYALGCILFEMLSGGVPFYDESVIKILFSHVNDEAPPLSYCSKNMQAIVERCLQKDPALRYQSVAELVADLKAVQDGAPLLHARRAKSERNATVFAVALVLGIVAILVIGLSTFTKQRWEEAALATSWTKEYSQALNFKQSRQYVEEERQLEKCLDTAKKSKSELLVSMTLQELSEAEKTLGKNGESKEHAETLKNRINRGGLSQFFLQVAFLLIGVGGILVFLAIWIFGPGGLVKPQGGRTLHEFLLQKKPRR